MFVVTGGSTSIRQFERPCRMAGAAARVLLCQAAAARWDTEWEQCQVDKGFVTFGKKTLGFADLVADAADYDVPDPYRLRPSPLQPVCRATMRCVLIVAAKVDGSVSFAGDIRLPDMLFASVRGGPIGDTTLKSVNSKGAFKIQGVVKLIKTDHWVAALATNWWAANRALDAMSPVFETNGQMADSAVMNATLDQGDCSGQRAPHARRGMSRRRWRRSRWHTRVQGTICRRRRCPRADRNTHLQPRNYRNGRLSFGWQVKHPNRPSKQPQRQLAFRCR